MKRLYETPIFNIVFLLLVVGWPVVSQAMRTRKPPTFTDLEDPNQLAELNNFLQDTHNLMNGRYTLENIVTNPQDVRKGTKGDLVYATFGGNDHLCVSTSFPEGKNWTCVNVGTLATCPGGADTQVQFNDNGNCGGDVSFIYDKNLNHAALGTSATAVVSGITVINEDTRLSQSFTLRDATQVLNVRENISGISDDAFGIVSQLNWVPTSTAATTEAVVGLLGAVDISGAGTISNTNATYGVEGYANYGGTSTVGAGGRYFGVVGLAEAISSGDVNWLVGGWFETRLTSASSSAITNAYSLYTTGPFDAGTGTIANSYGAYISTQQDGTTANYGLYVDGVGGNPNTTTNLKSVIEHPLGIGPIPTAWLNVDKDDITGVTNEQMESYFETHTVGLASGTTLANQRSNVFEAPTLNGVAGGATETVTDAATVFIDAAPSGSNITLTTSADLMFGETSTTAATIKVQDELTSNTVGRYLTLEAADGLGAGDGGTVLLNAGDAGATGDGGDISLTAETGGVTSGDGGDISITAGNATAAGTGDIGGDLTLQAGESNGQARSGAIIVTRGSQVGLIGTTSYRNLLTNDILVEQLADGQTLDNYAPILFIGSLLRGVAGGGTETFSNASTLLVSGAPQQSTNATVNNTAAFRVDGDNDMLLNDGQTRSFQAEVQFYAPAIGGVAGGGTETVTNAATVYIDNAPTVAVAGNITFTNGPYALWSDAGRNRFDGFVDMFASATVTGILTVDGTTTVNNTITSSRSTDLGWSVVTGANTACNTTCVNACVFGQDTDTANGPIVGCTDATADRCTCAGAN